MKNPARNQSNKCSVILDTNLTKATDSARWAGIGTDPIGGVGVAYLPVPSDPTIEPNNRYFGHLSTVYVPDFFVGQLVGLRQSIVIGTERRANPESEVVYTEQEQLSPFWSFPDGNVTWFVTWTPGRPRQPLVQQPGQPAENFSNEIYITHAAWLAKRVSPYLPLNGGMPPGQSVAQFDVLTSLLFQYRTQGFSFYEGSPHVGPGRFDLYVSVRQTNPARDRGDQPQPPPVPTRIEDIFVRDNPLARYMSVAGDIAVRRIEFSAMRSTAEDRWSSSLERQMARFYMEEMKKNAQEILKDKSAPPELLLEAKNVLRNFPLSRNPRPKTELEKYIERSVVKILKKKTRLP